MPIHPRNNKSEVGKEFAIGTIIKYDGKSYEVVKHEHCDNCSIKSFCNASDEYIPTSVIPRDKLISIFGKCSATDRDDNTSVVFIEVPKYNSKYEYYKISPLFVYNNPTQLRPIELALPKGYVIDKEHSDLDKGIIRFKNKWLSLEQIYNMAKATNYHTYLSEIRDSTDDKSCTVRKKLIALANLMDIASYFNGGLEYDVTEEVVGYLISYDRFVKEPCYNIRKNNSTTDVYYGNPVFKNEADAQYVIDNPNFRSILDVIFKV